MDSLSTSNPNNPIAVTAADAVTTPAPAGTSILANAGLEEADFKTYSTQELESLQSELSTRTQFLDMENHVFESHHLRVMGVKDKKLAAKELEDSLEERERGWKKKKNDKKELDKLLSLTFDQKSEIATRELEEMKDEVSATRESWKRNCDNIRSELEEFELRATDTKKASYEFKREVAIGGMNPRTGQVALEKVVKYFEEKIRTKDGMIEKTRLKNASIRVNINKLANQLKQKEEMGESLHSIDFDQLQIENKQYMARIEERNAELLKLKLTAGNTIQTLNEHKKQLQDLMSESEKLQGGIQSRRQVLDKLQTEQTNVRKENENAIQVYQSLRKQIEQISVPSIMDYVNVKVEEEELRKKLKTWERKVEIAAMQLTKLRTEIKKANISVPHTAKGLKGLEVVREVATANKNAYDASMSFNNSTSIELGVNAGTKEVKFPSINSIGHSREIHA